METVDKKKRVLIVDDEEDMIWSLQKNLPNESLPISISIASSGEEALSVLEEAEFDLIVTDIKMPGMSGIDLLIKVRNTWPDTGVIVMTAFPSTESKAEVIEKGGLRFIEKPFDINEMRGYIREALQMRSHAEGRSLGIQLIDIVQVNNLAGASNALRITAEEMEGVIYFADGDIVHAVCDGGLAGEEAYYALMRLQGGNIEAFFPDNSPETTIRVPVGSLLLKGALLSEKAGRDVDYLEELDLGFGAVSPSEETADEEGDAGPPASLAAIDPEDDGDDVQVQEEQGMPEPEDEPVFVDETSSEHTFEQEEEEMDALKELLGEFTNIPGVNTACLVGRDGFLLHSVALSGIDSEMIGAIASSGFGASEAMGKQLEKGSMSMTMVEYENGPVMLAPVGAEAFLVIVADKSANLGMIRLKIKKHSRDIEVKAGI